MSENGERLSFGLSFGGKERRQSGHKYSLKLSNHSSPVILGHRFSFQTHKTFDSESGTLTGKSSFDTLKSAKSSVSRDYEDYLDDVMSGEDPTAGEPLTAHDLELIRQ